MAVRLNPPPGWPHPPAGWTPPPGWRPDPSWPVPPVGWPLWVDDGPAPMSPTAAPHPAASTVALNWAAAGGGLVVVGSFMPFIATELPGLYEINPDARSTSALFGAVLVGLALGMRSAASRMACSILLLVAAALGVLGYGGFAAMGIAGFEDESELGFTSRVEFSPNVGLVACIAGCAIAFIAAIATLRSSPGSDSRRPTPPPTTNWTF